MILVKPNVMKCNHLIQCKPFPLSFHIHRAAYNISKYPSNIKKTVLLEHAFIIKPSRHNVCVPIDSMYYRHYKWVFTRGFKTFVYIMHIVLVSTLHFIDGKQINIRHYVPNGWKQLQYHQLISSLYLAPYVRLWCNM